jgi:ATP-dependent Clp protease ATP-binding subunit ClpA
LGTENTWRVYFQKLDKEMHAKIVEQQLLDVLAKFLEDHGIDVSELKERGSYILNNGVMVSGGSIQAEGLAVGEGAQAKVFKRPQK